MQSVHWTAEDLRLDSTRALTLEEFFDTLTLDLKSPEEYVREQVRQYLGWHHVEGSPDELLLVTLVIEDVLTHPGPWHARIGHVMTLTQAALANFQKLGVEQWERPGAVNPFSGGYSNSTHLSSPLRWKPEGYALSGQGGDIDHLGGKTLSRSHAYQAIFRKTDPLWFDASNQVALDPVAFKRFVWDAGFHDRYLTALDIAWTSIEPVYHLVIKAALFKAIVQQWDEGSLSVGQVTMAHACIGLPLTATWESTTMGDFIDARSTPEVRIHEFHVHGYVATDLFVITHRRQQGVLLYIPGNTSPLHGFDNLKELRDWVAHMCRDHGKRAALSSHFQRNDQRDGLFFSGVDHALRGIAVAPVRLDFMTGCWSVRKTVTLGEPWHYRPFSHFRDLVRQRFESDGDYQIGTQADYYQGRLAVGLELLSNMVGMLAMVIPPLMPLAAALGIGMVAVGTRELIVGKTVDEQREGGVRVVFGVLNAVPLLSGSTSQWRTTLETSSDSAAAVEGSLSHYAEIAAEPRPTPHIEDVRAPRPVLDGLPPEVRPRLQAMRVEAPTQIGNGKSSFVSSGRRYISIRGDVYRVEWDASVRRLRIRSPEEPLVWGPNVGATPEGYWDLDIRWGLKGGESFSGTLELAPPRDEYGIELEPLGPEVKIEVPLDVVATVRRDRYVLRTPSGELDVTYDADVGGFRNYRNPFEYVWAERSGWKRGDLKRFLKYRNARVGLSEGSSLVSLPRLHRLPTDIAPLERRVNLVWVGSEGPPENQLDTIMKNARNNPGWQFDLHTDIESPELLATLRSRLEQPNLKVRSIQEDSNLQAFIASEEGRAYRFYRGRTPKDYAFASDILRARILYEHGGMYLDCDDTIETALDSVKLEAKPHDVLLGGWMKFKQLPGHIGPNNSHYASRAGNPVLLRMIGDMNKRFDELPSSVTAFARPETGAELDAYRSRMFKVTGPVALRDAVAKYRWDYFNTLDRFYERHSIDLGPIDSSLYRDWINDYVDHYMPFRSRVRIRTGSAGSHA